MAKLTPPPQTGNGTLDRWLSLLWQKVQGSSSVSWSQIDTTGSNVPAGNISATTIQAAINELDAEKAAATDVVAMAVALG